MKLPVLVLLVKNVNYRNKLDGKVLQIRGYSAGWQECKEDFYLSK